MTIGNFGVAELPVQDGDGYWPSNFNRSIEKFVYASSTLDR